MLKNFLQNMVRVDIFPVLWQFLKNAAKPLIFLGFSAAPSEARGENRPS
jgi:hypothetical protein